MSSTEAVRTARVGESAAKQRTTISQVIVFIGETAMAKQQAKQRRSGEAAMLSDCICWRNGGEAAEAKRRSGAILRIGGAASPACAAACPPAVSKGWARPEGWGQVVGQDVRFGFQRLDRPVRNGGRCVAWASIPQRPLLLAPAAGKAA